MIDERHYLPRELAREWKLSENKIRDLFRDEPGVIRMGGVSRQEGKRLVRHYSTMRIPESVAQRVYERITLKKPVQSILDRPMLRGRSKRVRAGGL